MAYNSDVDLFQDTEYPMLTGKTYLDHGGATIYAKSLIETVAQDLITNLYGNPHSASDPAHLSGQIVDETREKTLRFFGADPEHFDLIFVQNATAAIKLVMESFKDVGESTKSQGQETGFRYFYHADSHNSVVGVREAADQGHHCFRTDEEVEKWLSGHSTAGRGNKLGLFAYPGQSNMTGRRLPLSWPGRLRDSQHTTHRDMYTLLDAAALATTYPLNGIFANPATAPDFTALSFYKIFGYPDLGGLIVRKASGRILSWGRKYFGGGTVEVVTVLGAKPFFEPRRDIHSSLEDGTLPFHNIIALSAAIDTHRRLYGPQCMTTISRHTNYLAKSLYDGMVSLVHSNGMPLVKIYNSGPAHYGNTTLQGSTISFNVLRPNGTYLPYTSVIETLANARKIYVRAGTLCNPGGMATNLGYEDWHIRRLYENGHNCSDAVRSGTEVADGKPTGVVRVSLGAMTTRGNIERMLEFLKEEFLETNLNLPVAGRGVGESVVDGPVLREMKSFREHDFERNNMSKEEFRGFSRHESQLQQRPQQGIETHQPQPLQLKQHLFNQNFTFDTQTPPHSRPPTRSGTGTAAAARSFSTDTTAFEEFSQTFSHLENRPDFDDRSHSHTHSQSQPQSQPHTHIHPHPSSHPSSLFQLDLTTSRSQIPRNPPVDFETMIGELEIENGSLYEEGREKLGRKLWRFRGRKESLSVR